MVKNALCRTILRGFFITLTSRRAEQRIRIFVTQTLECSENSFTVMFLCRITFHVHLGNTGQLMTGKFIMEMTEGDSAFFAMAISSKRSILDEQSSLMSELGVIKGMATSALVSHLFQSCQGDATKLLIMGWESKMQLPHGFHSKLNDSSPTSSPTRLPTSK